MTGYKDKRISLGLVPSFNNGSYTSAEVEAEVLGKPISEFGAIQLFFNGKLLFLSSNYLIDYQLYKEYMVGYEPLSTCELTDIIHDLFAFASFSVAMFEMKTSTLIGSALSHVLHEASLINALRLDRNSHYGLLLALDLTRFSRKEKNYDPDWTGNHKDWPNLLVFKDGFSNEMRALNTNQFYISFSNWLSSDQKHRFTENGLAIIHKLINDDNEKKLNDTELKSLNIIMPYIIENRLFTIHQGNSNANHVISWVICAGCIQSHVLHYANGCKTRGFTTEQNNIATTCPSMSITRIA